MFEAVVAQAKLLQGLGAIPVVIGLREEQTDADLWRLDGIEKRLVDQKGPFALGFAPGLPDAVAEAQLDLLQLHGVWQYPSHVAGDWASASGKPLVISPHGMFDPWITAHNAWKKHLARTVWEKGAWQAAAGFHALTDAEARDIDRETGGKPAMVIANPAPPLSSPSNLPRGPSALYLGRIHTKKNVMGLIEAWLEARPHLPDDATLTIAGWGDDAGVEILEQAMQRYEGAGLEFVGTAFGSQKAALFDVSRFLVLPSFSEGLPMAILEAWAANCPAIMSEHCHLPQGFERGAALRCGTDTASIRDALIEGLTMPEEHWQEMAQAARALAGGPFSSATIAEQWEGFYAKLLTP